MKLALYVARWGWGSLFVMLWLRTFGFLDDKPDLTLVSFVVFGCLTVLSTIVYGWLVYRLYTDHDMGGLRG